MASLICIPGFVDTPVCRKRSENEALNQTAWINPRFQKRDVLVNRLIVGRIV